MEFNRGERGLMRWLLALFHDLELFPCAPDAVAHFATFGGVDDNRYPTIIADDQRAATDEFFYLGRVGRDADSSRYRMAKRRYLIVGEPPAFEGFCLNARAQTYLIDPIGHHLLASDEFYLECVFFPAFLVWQHDHVTFHAVGGSWESFEVVVPGSICVHGKRERGNNGEIGGFDNHLGDGLAQLSPYHHHHRLEKDKL